MSIPFQEITTSQWLGFSVIGAGVTAVGNFIALYAKEFVAARSLERWKTRQALAAVYDRYRRPIAAASEELSGRCYRHAKRYEKWREEVGVDLLSPPFSVEQLSAAANDRYLRYSLLSDAYRLCCFLGWLELYRRDIGLLNFNQMKEGRNLELIIREIRSDLADGQLNYHQNWHEWRDSLIFREEQRAIAHRMIASEGPVSLIDFGAFCDVLQEEIADRAGRGWFVIAVRFYSNLKSEGDFRLTRMKRLVVHLSALRELVQPGSVPVNYLTGSAELEKELSAEKDAATIRTKERP